MKGLKKLDVGDLVAYERWLKDKKRAELISTMKELYGDNMPPDAVIQIDRELKSLPSLFGEGQTEIDAESVQYLIYRSMLKTNPNITFDEVGESMNMDNLMEYVNEIMPVPDNLGKKKTTRKRQ